MKKKKKMKEDKASIVKNLNKKNNRGITLIALIVTIIVMLILAGIVVARLTGDNGIITKASNANKKQIEANVTEKIELAVEAAKLDAKSKLTQNLYLAESNLEATAKVMGKELNENEDLIARNNLYQLVCTSSSSEGRITVTYGKAEINGDASSITGGNEDYAKVCNYENAVIVATIKVKGNEIEIVRTEGSAISEDGKEAEIINLAEETGDSEETTTKIIKIKKNNTAIISSTDVSLGDEVTIGDEHFYVITNNKTKVTLLSKYCIDVEDLSQVNGTYSTEATRFSSNDFWINRSGIIYPYDFPAEDYENENIYALYPAAKYGEKIGTTGRLMYYSEAYTLKEKISDIIYGKNIGATEGYLNYWLGTAGRQVVAYINGNNNSLTYQNVWGGAGNPNSSYWIRPVLEILWENI